MVDGARVHNIKDGWKPHEAAATRDVSATYPNVGVMAMRNVYMTGIRDDAIEDDEFMPGDIQDSLFDGVWCFLSEQNQTGGNPSTIGPGEDGNIRIPRVTTSACRSPTAARRGPATGSSGRDGAARTTR